jgi:hypothetical protein
MPKAPVREAFFCPQRRARAPPLGFAQANWRAGRDGWFVRGPHSRPRPASRPPALVWRTVLKRDFHAPPPPGRSAVPCRERDGGDLHAQATLARSTCCAPAATRWMRDRRRRRARGGGAPEHGHRRRLLLPLRPGRHRTGDRAERLGRAPRGATRRRWRRGLTQMEPLSVPLRHRPGAISAGRRCARAHGRKGLDELLQPASASRRKVFICAARRTGLGGSGRPALQAPARRGIS